MIQNLFRYFGGIESYGIISMCLFAGVFIGVLIWAFAQEKSHLDYMSRVALDQEDCGSPGPSGSTFASPRPSPQGEGEPSSVERRNLTSGELQKGIYE
jgi:hypothetical protein